MKIKTLLALLFILSASLISFLSYFSYTTLITTEGYIGSTLENSVTYQTINDDMRLSQINFQRQIQEWKDILVRGNDDDLYNKYFSAFEAREFSTDTGLEKIKTALRSKGNESLVVEVDNLLTEHRKLGENYREALRQFNHDDPEAGKKVDILVRGIDRPTSQALEKTSKTIKDLSDTQLKKTKTDIKTNFASKILSLEILAGITLLLIGIICLSISLRVLKIIGIDPEIINVFFKQLASGNFKANIEVNKKDKESVAYNAKLMQFKLKNLIISIRNLSDEVIKNSSKAQIDSTKEQIDEIIIETKNITRGLKETTEKFSV